MDHNKTALVETKTVLTFSALSNLFMLIICTQNTLLLLYITLSKSNSMSGPNRSQVQKSPRYEIPSQI